MLPGNYNPGPVIEATLRIYVNGIERPHIAASYGIDSDAGLPSTFVQTGTGISSRTGTVTWAPRSVIESKPFKPIGETRWTPKRGDEIIIESEVAGVKFREFTGRIGATTFNIADSSAVSDISDGLGTYLAQKISLDHRKGRVTPDWQIYRALEYAGLGALPAPDKATVAHFHGQYNSPLADIAASFTPGGMSGDNSYGIQVRGITSMTPVVGTPTADPFIITRVNPLWGAEARITMNGTMYRLIWRNEARKYLLYKGAEKLLDVEAEGEDPMPLLAFTVGRQDIRVWVSREKSISVPVKNAWGAVTLWGKDITGISLRYLDGQEEQQMVIDSMIARPLGYRGRERRPANTHDGLRGYEATTAESIVKQYCDATLSALAMDEYGTPRLIARERMLRTSPTARYQISEKVFNGHFSQGQEEPVSKVVVNHLTSYLTSQGRDRGTLLYQPENIQEINMGDTFQQIISPADDVDWYGPDLKMRPIIDSSDGEDNRADFNVARGSYWQICFEDPDRDGEMRWTGRGFEDVQASIEQIGQRAFKIVHSVTNGSEKLKYYLASPSLGVDVLRAGNRGVPMPMIRGDSYTTWVDAHEESEVLGPARAPVFTLEAGWWLPAVEAKIIADMLAAELTTPRMVLENLPMLWDPRIQLFDVISLIGSGWEADCLVMGKEISWDGNVPSASYGLSVVALRDTVAGKTYSDLAKAYATYSQIPSTASYDAVFDQLPERL